MATHRPYVIPVLGVFVAACAAPLGKSVAQEAANVQNDAELAARIEPLVRRAMEPGLVPGLQVAVVTADGRRWSAGFGVADLETGRPVDDHTRFYLASTTKALTAMAATRLAHRGALDLDASLATAFRGVRFPAGYPADAVTVRDLLTHTHGLRQGAASFRIAFTGEYTNEWLVQFIGQGGALDDRSFRYTNYGYDLVGLLLDRERTRGWQPIVEREVLDPLGMTRTTSVVSSIPADEIAMPHELGRDGMARIALTKGDGNMGPAGGHFSTARDLGRLLLAQLGRGMVDGRQVIEPEVIAETQRAQVPQQRRFIHYERHAWGLGWDIGTVDGDTVVHRPGGFAGYYSNAAFMPEHGFGVVVLTNGGAAGARLAETVAKAIYDEMRGKDDPMGQLEDALEELVAASAQSREQMAARPAPALAERPTRDWDAYAGRYVNESFGTAEVTRTSSGVEIHIGPMRSALLPLAGRDDAFSAELVSPNDEVTFRVDGSGRPVALTIRGLDGEWLRQ